MMAGRRSEYPMLYAIAAFADRKVTPAVPEIVFLDQRFQTSSQVDLFGKKKRK